MTETTAAITMIERYGMELEEWKLRSCTAEFGVGDDWATVYFIESKERNKGDATELLRQAKAHYESQGKRFGGTVALNRAMQRVYEKLNIHEYKDYDD